MASLPGPGATIINVTLPFRFCFDLVTRTALLGSATATARSTLEVRPPLSVTVSLTVYVPAFVYVCEGVAPAALPPSPKLQL